MDYPHPSASLDSLDANKLQSRSMQHQHLDPVALYAKAVAQARQTVPRIQPAQLQLPTPCTAWDVATLLEHMLDAQAGWAARISGAPLPTATGNLERLARSTKAILCTVRPAGGLEKQV